MRNRSQSGSLLIDKRLNGWSRSSKCCKQSSLVNGKMALMILTFSFPQYWKNLS
jgi:hypothetical protein